MDKNGQQRLKEQALTTGLEQGVGAGGSGSCRARDQHEQQEEGLRNSVLIRVVLQPTEQERSPRWKGRQNPSPSELGTAWQKA